MRYNRRAEYSFKQLIIFNVALREATIGDMIALTHCVDYQKIGKKTIIELRTTYGFIEEFEYFQNSINLIKAVKVRLHNDQFYTLKFCDKKRFDILVLKGNKLRKNATDKLVFDNFIYKNEENLMKQVFGNDNV